MKPARPTKTAGPVHQTAAVRTMTIAAHDRAAGHANAVTRAIRILGLAAAIVTSVLAASGGAWPDAANWPRSDMARVWDEF